MQEFLWHSQESVPSLACKKGGIRKFLALIWSCAIPRLYPAIPFSMTHLLKDFSIGICRLLCLDFPWFSFHLLCTIPEGTEQSGPYFPVTHLVCLIFHGIEGKMCPSFFFYCVKLVDFLPVNGVGLPLAVQREVWHSQWELSHKKKIPVLQSN